MVLKRDINIEGIKQLLKDALLAEWQAQGHDMGGNVVSEIEWLLDETFNGLTLTANMFAYGVYHESGVPAARIPFGGGSGASTSQYIQGLIRYVERRMQITDLREAKSIAFAIAKTQKKEGMPTAKSYSYSTTGKRTGWIDDAISKNTDKLGQFVRENYRRFMVTEFENLVKKHSKNL